MDLQTEFLSLTRASSEAEFIAIALSSTRHDFLAKAKDGSPVFLFQDASIAKYTPGLKLRNLTVEFHVTCRVQTAAGPIEDQFALVSCDDSVPAFGRNFLLSPKVCTLNRRFGLGGVVPLIDLTSLGSINVLRSRRQRTRFALMNSLLSSCKRHWVERASLHRFYFSH